MVGLAGLVIAPIASLGTRELAMGAQDLAFAAQVAHDPSPLAVAALKGVEYACLGVAVAWLRKRHWAHATHHAAAGLCVGLTFGGCILALTAAAQPLTPVVLAGWLVNELLFPVGCALVLFHAARTARTARPTAFSRSARPRGGHQAA